MVKDINRMMISVILVIFFLFLFIPKIELADNNSATNKKLYIGDVDGNGIIEMRDVVDMLKHISNEKTKKHSDWKLNDEQFKRADINEDNQINVNKDVIPILKYLAAKKSTKIASKHPDWLSLLDGKNSVIVPTDITLDKSTLNLKEGQNSKLTATVVPKDAEDKRVNWKSSNEKIAIVDEYGNIKAIKEGKCSINVTTWNGKTKACVVIVKKFTAENANTTNNTTNSTSGGSGSPSVTDGGTVGPGGGSPGGGSPGSGSTDGPYHGDTEDGEEVEIRGFNIEASKRTIYTYESGKITIKPEPENASTKGVKFKSSNTNILKIKGDGTYTAGEKDGTVEVTVSVDGFEDYDRNTSIVVKKCRMDEIKMNDDFTRVWDDNKDSMYCRISAKIYAEKGAKYDYITNKEVMWTTSNEKLCKINTDKITKVEGVDVGREVAIAEITQPGLYNISAGARDTYNAGAADNCVITVLGVKAKEKNYNINYQEKFDLEKAVIAFNKSEEGFTNKVKFDIIKGEGILYGNTLSAKVNGSALPSWYNDLITIKATTMGVEEYSTTFTVRFTNT